MINDPNRRPIDGGLQAIAGMIRKLTYREMHDFTWTLVTEMQADVPVARVAEALLATADKLAITETPPGLVKR